MDILKQNDRISILDLLSTFYISEFLRNEVMFDKNINNKMIHGSTVLRNYRGLWYEISE